MGKWKEEKLSFVVKQNKDSIRRGPFGSSLKKSFFVPDGYKVYQQGNAIRNDFNYGEYYINLEKYKELEAFKIVPGDIIISCSGTIGKTAVVPDNAKEGIINQALLKLTLDTDKILRKYFIYFFDYYVIQGQLKTKGAAIKNIVGVKTLKNIKIPLPQLPEQERIVSKLDTLFAEIDVSLALIDQNIAQAEALKLSMLDEEFSSSNNKVKVSTLIKKTNNLNPKEIFKDETFTYIDISSVNKEFNIIEEPKTLKGVEAPSRARKAVKSGDVIFATTRPNLKNIAIVEMDYKNPIASTGFCVLRPITDKLINKYLFYFLLTNNTQDQIEPFIRGAQYPAISDKDLKGIEFPVVSIKEQQKIVDKIDSLFAETDALVSDYKEKRANLEALKSSLLDSAFKGEL